MSLAERGRGRCAPGMTLVELLLAAALSALLVLGLVQITSAASRASALQRNQAQLQEHARFASDLLSGAVREAGFRPRPWDGEHPVDALAETSQDAVSTRGDRLALRSWSDRNCFDNRNPERDADGRALFYLRESSFDLTADGHLAHQCRYGPTNADLVTQIRRQGLVPGVEAFQVLYGEDTDGDGQVERWVRAGEWGDAGRVLGLRADLLLASEEAVVEPTARDWDVLGQVVRSPADGRARRLLRVAAAIRGRLP